MKKFIDPVPFTKISVLTSPDLSPIEPGYTVSFGELKTHMPLMCNHAYFFSGGWGFNGRGCNRRGGGAMLQGLL